MVASMNFLGFIYIDLGIECLGHLVEGHPIRVTLTYSETDPADAVIGIEINAEFNMLDPLSKSGYALKTFKNVFVIGIFSVV